jgi:NCAIR mutase (PurE)-related protein
LGGWPTERQMAQSFILLMGLNNVNKRPMNPSELQTLIHGVARGEIDEATAQAKLLEMVRARPFEDLGFARVDHHRASRQGFPEVVLGLGKTPAQIAAIAAEIAGRGSTLLVTRASEAAYAAVVALVPQAAYYADAALITFRQQDVSPGNGTIVVAAAGTSDLFVAEEAARTAELMGNHVERVYDVGVAGLHRVLGERARLAAARVIVVVAGMEGALPSVIAGLVAVPVIAVPTSIGYGASFGGIAALLGMLNSCSSGVSVVNIDNGFGAASIASLINHL